MQQNTPDHDKAARTIAETVYAAFIRIATTPGEPLEEQTGHLEIPLSCEAVS